MFESIYNLSLAERESIGRAHGEMQSEPLAILALCRRLGVLYRGEACLAELDMRDTLAGIIKRFRGNSPRAGKYEIVYSLDASIARQRFTVTHLLAHYLLHREQLPDLYEENVLFRGGLSTTAEREATRLAGDILMPEYEIDNFTQGERAFSIRAMARRFGVTPQCVSVRMGIPIDL